MSKDQPTAGPPAVPALPSGARQQEEQELIERLWGACGAAWEEVATVVRAYGDAAYARGLEEAAQLVEERCYNHGPRPISWCRYCQMAMCVRALGSVATAPTAPSSSAPSGALAGAEELTTQETNQQRAATRDTSNPEER